MTSLRLWGGMLVAMPTAMPGRAVDQQVGNLRRQDGGSCLLVVVVRAGSRRSPCRCRPAAPGDLLHPALGVPVGRRRDRRRPSRSCPARRSAGSASRSPGPCAPGRRRPRVSPWGWYFPMTSPTMRAHLMYGRFQTLFSQLLGVQDPAVHRLEAVAHVGQRPRDDDAHGVVHERGLHLLLDGHRNAASHRWRGRSRRRPSASVYCVHRRRPTYQVLDGKSRPPPCSCAHSRARHSSRFSSDLLSPTLHLGLAGPSASLGPYHPVTHTHVQK